jgi:hypothetical protein
MPRYTGIHGAVGGVASLMAWSLSDSSASPVDRTGATGGLPVRGPGIKSYSGSISRAGSMPPVFPGGTMAFVGYMSPTTGVPGTNGPGVSGLAIIKSATIKWDWTTNKALSVECAFGAASDFVFADTAAPALVPGYAPTYPCGSNIKWRLPGGAVLLDILETKTATLSITNATQTIVDAGSGCLQLEGPGNPDLTVSIELSTPDRPIATNNLVELHLPVGASAYRIKYLRCKGYSNLKINRESGEFISQTVDFEWSSLSGAIVGSLYAPDNSLVYGVADV